MKLVLRILLVVVVAIIAGSLTPIGQQYLPDSLRSLANSAGGWSMVVVLVIWASRLRPVPAAILGFVAFAVMLEAYSVVSGLRGHPDNREIFGIWGLIAIVAGPVLGIAASWLHSTRRVLIAVGAGAIAAPLGAEAVYGLTVIADTTSPVYWWIQGGLAIALVVTASATLLHAPRWILLCAVIAAAGTALGSLAFSAL